MNTNQIDRALREACDEAFRRARNGNRSTTTASQSREISIREPGRPGSAINRESATLSGSTINLQENRTVNTQQLPTPKDTHERMVESFRRLGLSDEGAERAAAGRNPEPTNIVDAMPASLRESLNRIGGVGDIQPGSIVIFHPTEADMRESERLAAQQETEAKSQAVTRADMEDAFRRMGFSASEAAQAARGR